MGKKIFKGVFMKNFMKLVGIIVFAAAIVFPLAALGVNDGAASPRPPSAGATPSGGRGTLTITGLGSYNGYFIYAEAYIDNTNEKIVAASDVFGVMHMEFMRGVEISNGSVTLPVWKILGYNNETDDLVINKERYSGNDKIDFHVFVWGESDSYSPQSMGSINSLVSSGVLSVSFTNGTASGVIELPDSSGYSIFEMF